MTCEMSSVRKRITMFDVSPRPLNPSPAGRPVAWPAKAQSALMIGFDFDAECVWFGNNCANVQSSVTMSYGGYGPRVGVPKVLEILKDVGLKATFFVPGWTVRAHAESCERILKDGHEIAHHGYLHKLPDPTRLDEAFEEIDLGLVALKEVLGVAPLGYRAPNGECFPELLQYLHSKGIRYSSSYCDDVHPYRHQLPGGTAGPVELPINFAFDDWYFGMSNRMGQRSLFGRDAVLPLWIDEFDVTHSWGGVTSMVLHPQVSGRPMRTLILRDFLTHVLNKNDVWIATGAEISAHVLATANSVVSDHVRSDHV